MEPRQDFSLRPAEARDADLVLRWRNLESVRSMMFTSDPIAPEDHAKWFKSLEGNTARKCLIFERRGEAYGVVVTQLYRPEQSQWIWSCYLGRPGEIVGGGTIMGYLAMEYFFEKLGIENLIGEAVETNEHSIKFNVRLGFERREKFLKRVPTGKDLEARLLVYPRADWPRHKARLLAELFAPASE